MEGTDVVWRRSTHSNDEGNCVEVARVGGAFATRDSKDPEGPAIFFGARAWVNFLTGLKADEFN